MKRNLKTNDQSITTPDIILLLGGVLVIAVFIYGSFFMTK